MTPANPYFIAALLIVVAFFKLDLFANLFNLSALKPELPEQFKDVYDREKYARSQAYTRETTRFGILSSSISLAAFFAFWFIGGFGFVDAFTRSLGYGEVVTGLIAVAILLTLSGLLELPFEIYDTFVLEEHYGFNKTTFGTFIVDKLKGLALGLILGAPILALLLTLFEKVDHAWLYAWASVSGLSLILAYVAPRFILPLFNKFTPLEDGELRTAITAMGDKAGFPLQEVSVMDGSKRSTKSNAFFTGFGKNKRIALFDTLIENHSTDELVAVLAHEIGHFKKKHIIQQMAFGILHTGALLFLLSLFLESTQLFSAFAVATPSVHFAFIFFGILFKPVNRLISILLAVWSRKNEYEADAYAAELTGTPESLVTALKKLAADNLSNLTPHPFYVFLNYSHPPMLERLKALKAL